MSYVGMWLWSKLGCFGCVCGCGLNMFVLGGCVESERAWLWSVWVDVERVRELGGGLFGWMWSE